MLISSEDLDLVFWGQTIGEGERLSASLLVDDVTFYAFNLPFFLGFIAHHDLSVVSSFRPRPLSSLVTHQEIAAPSTTSTTSSHAVLDHVLAPTSAFSWFQTVKSVPQF